MPSILTSPQAASLLDSLYADAAKNDPLAFQAAQEAGLRSKGEAEFYKGMGKAYMAVGREFGHLLYSLVRGTKAKTVVEFGTSFGISTVYLAAAVRDNGSGRIITTEFESGKAAQAKKNLAAAGLDDLVEFRIGDALETLAHVSGEVDFLFLDGAKGLYLSVLKLLEPRLRPGSLVASDNTDHDGMESFLAHIRNPANGYLTSAILTDAQRPRGHEITIRI
jgi:predicted O-methyltransferase YrrM